MSSAPAISCSGRERMPSSSSARPCGPTSPRPTWTRRSPPSPLASAVTAPDHARNARPDRRRACPAGRGGGAPGRAVAVAADRPHRLPSPGRAHRPPGRRGICAAAGAHAGPGPGRRRRHADRCQPGPCRGAALLAAGGHCRPRPADHGLRDCRAGTGHRQLHAGRSARRIPHLGPADGSAATSVGGLGLPAGSAWMLMLLLVVWGYDTGAYLTGRWLGRRRLIDHVSPSKTLEGLAGGLVAATLAAGIGAWLIGLAPWHPLVIGPLVGLAAQA